MEVLWACGIFLRADWACDAIPDLNASLATIRLGMEECTVSRALEGTVVATPVGGIKVGFETELQQVSFETEARTGNWWSDTLQRKRRPSQTR